MKISEFAKAGGVSVETVRFYQRTHLLRVPPSAGVRTYSAGDLKSLRFIRRAQSLGFTLAEVRELLALSARDCVDVTSIAKRRQESVAAKIADLQRIDAALRSVIGVCTSKEPHEECPIVAALLD